MKRTPPRSSCGLESVLQVEQSPYIRNSAIVSSPALDRMRDDRIISDIMENAEIVDVQAMEETVGGDADVGVSDLEEESEAFVPRNTWRRQNEDLSCLVEDDLPTEHNFTIEH